MYLTILKIIPGALLVTALAACGRDETAAGTSTGKAQNATKTEVKKAEEPVVDPQVADPLKEGY